MSEQKHLQIVRINKDSDTSSIVPKLGEPIYDTVHDYLYVGDGTRTIDKLNPYRKSCIYSGKLENKTIYINDIIKLNKNEPVELLVYIADKSYIQGNSISIKYIDSETLNETTITLSGENNIFDLYGLKLPDNGYVTNTVNTFYLVYTDGGTYKLFVNSPVARWN